MKKELFLPWTQKTFFLGQLKTARKNIGLVNSLFFPYIVLISTHFLPNHLLSFLFFLLPEKRSLTQLMAQGDF